MKSSIKSIAIGLFIIFGFTVPLANATSIVVQLGEANIIVASDTRQDQSTQTLGHIVHRVSEDMCKLVRLGRAAVGVTGASDYHPNSPFDPIHEWSAFSDAQAVYKGPGSSLRLMADEWAERSRLHYTLFYSVTPQRVIELANANAQHVLVAAFVVGWENSTPLLVFEMVYLDGPFIRTMQQILPARKLPYTTNAITQGLIEGTRAQIAIEKWDEASKGVEQQNLEWRQIEMFIKLTSEYDPTVGTTVNVLGLPKDSEATWLQNFTCTQQ